MSRFTAEEFERAFQEVYPSQQQQPFSEECKQFLGFLLTDTHENVSSAIESSMGDSTKMDKINKCLETIIGNISIYDLNRFIGYVNVSSVNSDNILEIMNQQPDYMYTPIFRICLQMLKNKERGPLQAPPTSAPTSAPASAPTSAPASARQPNTTLIFSNKPPKPTKHHTPHQPASARPLASATTKPASARTPHSTSAHSSAPPTTPFTYHEQNLKSFHTNDASVERGSVHPGSSKAGAVGGSRRRRTSHRKRKGYRKSKRVRHTPRKQTRRHRHRHRRSRHRHRR